MNVIKDGSHYQRVDTDNSFLLEGLLLDAANIQTSIVLRFSSSETLHGGNALVVDEQVLTSHTGAEGEALSGKQAAWRSSKISKLPSTVFIRLQRNASNVTKRFSITETVDFSPACDSLLQAAPHNAVDGKPLVRSLTAAVVHVGNVARSGHYYTLVRHHTGSWYPRGAGCCA